MKHFKHLIAGFALVRALFVRAGRALPVLLALLPMAAQAATNVPYAAAYGVSGGTHTTNDVGSGTTTWDASANDGWYSVSGDVTIGSRVTVSGTVNLILMDGCSLTASGGINVSSGNSLTIWGQSGGTGKLSATGQKYSPSGAAGIGGGYDENGGTIIINGGVITARGAGGSAQIYVANAGAGIGGGYNYSGGNVTVNGGVVMAFSGGGNAAHIGKGANNGSNGSLTINGGLVFQGGGLTKSGTLNGDLTIPSGMDFTISGDQTLTVANGATLTVNGGLNVQGGLTNNGTITNNGDIGVEKTFTNNGTVTNNSEFCGVNNVGGSGSWNGTPYFKGVKFRGIINMSNNSPLPSGGGWTYGNSESPNYPYYTVQSGNTVAIVGNSTGSARRVVLGNNSTLIVVGHVIIDPRSGPAPAWSPVNYNGKATITGDGVLELQTENKTPAFANTPTSSLIIDGNVAVISASIRHNTATVVKGLYINGANGTVNGDVTLPADFTIPAGVTVSITEGSTLTVPPGVKLTNNGTLVAKEGGVLSVGEQGAVHNPGAIYYYLDDGIINPQYITGNAPVKKTVTTAKSGSNIIDMGDEFPPSNGDGWVYESNLYRIRDNGVTVTGDNAGSSRRVAIESASSRTVTLDGATITVPGGNTAIHLEDGAKVTFTLAGNSVLTGNGGSTGINVSNNASATLIGAGTLQVSSSTANNGISVSTTGGAFTLNGNVAVTASGNTGTAPVVTKGLLINGNTGTVGGDVTLGADFTIPANKTLAIPATASLTIPSGITLTNADTITVQGTLNIPVGGTLTNNGRVTPAAGSTVTVDGTVNGASKIDGANASKPTLNTKTHNSVTLDPATLAATTGQEIEYGMAMTNDGYLLTWQDGPVFSNAPVDATRYYFARSKENDAFKAGTQSYASNPIKTDKIPVTVDIVADGEADRITSTKLTLTFSESVTGLTKGNIAPETAGGGVIPGAFSGNGTTYTFAITTTTAGNMKVTVGDFGRYTVTNSPVIVAVYKDIRTIGSLGTQSDPLTYGTAGTVTYSGITMTNFSDMTDEPVTFSPSAAGLTGTITVANSVGTLTLNTSAATPAGDHSSITFTVDGKTSNAFTLTVDRRPVTITGVTAENKVYNGDNVAVIKGTPALSVNYDDANLYIVDGGASAAFNNKNVDNDKTVAFSGYALGGSAAPNYELKQPADVKANITPCPVTITGVTAKNKVYDSNATAEIQGTPALSVNYDGGNLSIDDSKASATFADKNVGDDKTVTFFGYALDGLAKDNYELTEQPETVKANITKKPIDIIGASIASKTYDTQTDATITGVTFDDDLDGLKLNTDFTAGGDFDDANAGTSRTVTVSVSLTGTEKANNYTVSNSPWPLTAQTISPAPIGSATVTVGGTYTYNATAQTPASGDVTVELSPFSTLVYGTEYTFAATNNTDAGTTALLTVTGTGNFTGTAQQNFTIGKKTISIDGASITFDTKTYDGTAAATMNGTPTLVGVVGSDVSNVGINSSAVTYAFTSANAGTTAVHRTNDYSLSGNRASNYLLTQPADDFSATAIAKKQIAVIGGTVTAKDYDGTDAATVTELTFNGLVSLETLVLGTDYSVSDAVFDSETVGTGKTVTGTVTLNGTDKAKNYKFASASLPFNFSGNEIKQKNIAAAAVQIAGTYIYNSTPQTPAAGDITVTLTGFGTLTDGTDYTYAVTSGGTDVGAATVTVTGAGNFTGTATGTFEILPNIKNGIAISGDTVSMPVGGQFLFTFPEKMDTATVRTVTLRNTWDGTTAELTGYFLNDSVTFVVDYRRLDFRTAYTLALSGFYDKAKLFIYEETFAFVTQDFPSPPAVARYITLPALSGVVMQPAAGSHRIQSGSDFTFTLTPPAGMVPHVTTDRNLGGAPETLKGTPNADGSYTFVIRDVRENITVSITFATGNETVGAASLKVWPNPVPRGGTARLEYGAPDNTEVRIYTMQGTLVSVQKLQNGQAMLTFPQVAGVYVVRVGSATVKATLK